MKLNATHKEEWPAVITVNSGSYSISDPSNRPNKAVLAWVAHFYIIYILLADFDKGNRKESVSLSKCL